MQFIKPQIHNVVYSVLEFRKGEHGSLSDEVLAAEKDEVLDGLRFKAHESASAKKQKAVWRSYGVWHKPIQLDEALALAAGLFTRPVADRLAAGGFWQMMEEANALDKPAAAA